MQEACQSHSSSQNVCAFFASLNPSTKIPSYGPDREPICEALTIGNLLELQF
mgnify:CR=1 FL=1